MTVTTDMLAIAAAHAELCDRIHEHTFAHWPVPDIEVQAAQAAGIRP